MRTNQCVVLEHRGPRGTPTLPNVPGVRQDLPDRRNDASRTQLLQRVRAEFDELPALKLTLAQAQRLFGLREDICRRVLHTLTREGLLRVGPGDFYARRDLPETNTSGRWRR